MLSSSKLASSRGFAREAGLNQHGAGRVAPKYPGKVQAQSGALALPSIREGSAEHHGGHDHLSGLKAFTSGCGFVIGDILSQTIVGGKVDAFRSVQAGCVGSALDILRQDIARNSEGRTGRAAKLAHDMSSQMVFAPIVMCSVYSILKIIEGNPGEIVQGLEDKLTALAMANYVLWPMTRFLNDNFIPAEHRIVANHITTVVWNAWLSTLGHAPLPDVSHLFSSTGANAAVQHVSHAVAPIMQHAAEAVSPFVTHAAQGVAAMAERMPSCLLEKAFSKSLDVLSPLASVERSPSQLLETAASLGLQRAGTLELVLDRLHSTHL